MNRTLYIAEENKREDHENDEQIRKVPETNRTYKSSGVLCRSLYSIGNQS